MPRHRPSFFAVSQPPLALDKSNCRVVAICTILVLVTAAVYAPVRHFDFISFDDFDYVTDNPPVRTGLRMENVRWAFTHSHMANWHPVTWLSHMLDCELWGRNAGAHHVTSVVFHAINAVLLFL